MPIAKLERTVLRLSGDKVKEWLSGLITNSIVDEVTFAALLTPQGKIIADFFITQSHDDLLICLLYTSPSPRDQRGSRMPSSA